MNIRPSPFSQKKTNLTMSIAGVALIGKRVGGALSLAQQVQGLHLQAVRARGSPARLLLQSVSAGRAPARFQRLLSSEEKPDITPEDCMKLLHELKETAEHLQRRLKVINNLVLLMSGLSAGALVGVMAQNFSNKGDNAKWETHLDRSDGDLKRGVDLLNRTEISVTELKDLVGSLAAQSSDGPSKDVLVQDQDPSEST